MIAKLTQTLQRLQTDWAAQLQSDAIQAACDAVGYTQWRDRLLNPVVTVQVFLLQMLHGNTACRHLPHLSGLHFSASAYCQARTKLPLAGIFSRGFIVLLSRGFPVITGFELPQGYQLV